MGVDINSVSLLFLLGIPGIICKDDYDVGGMVAASAMGLLFLVAAIIMGVFICFWPSYYHKQQLLRGKWRVARPKRKKWRWWSSKRTIASTVVTHPRSEHKTNLVQMYEIDGVHKGSRSSTLQGRVRAENWMHKLPYDTHETKSKTITLEHEDEPIIVADVLPPGTSENRETTRTYAYTDLSQNRNVGQTQYVTTEAGQSQYVGNEADVFRYTVSDAGRYTAAGADAGRTQYTTTTDVGRTQYTTTADAGRTQYTTTTTDTLEPIHIKLETMEADDFRSSQLRTTQLRSTQGQNEQIRLQVGQRADDIVITPNIPSTSQDYQERQTYQYQYTDSQEQPTPQGRQSVGEDDAVIQFGDGDSHND